MSETIPRPLSGAVEDYLKVIYQLDQEEGPPTTGRIAESLSVAAASVTGMVKKLAAGDPPLVTHVKHQRVSLTDEGRAAALRTLRRHRLIEQFLTQTLGYRLAEVHEEAERLEHAVSALFEARLARFLGNPARDPHGDPIPDDDLNLPASRARPLASLTPGQMATIRRVRSNDGDLLRYLEEQRLLPGERIAMSRVRSADGVLFIARQPDGEKLTVGKRIGDVVLVDDIN